MASVKVVGFATVVVNFDGLGLPDDPEIGKQVTDMMAADCAAEAGGKLVGHTYDPESKKLRMIFEDRRDALHIAWNFNKVFFVLNIYLQQFP